MVTGKPIVASGVPELTEYEPMIIYAHTAQEFSQKIADTLKNGTKINQKRIAEASQHGWENRATELKKLLLKTIA